MYDVILFTFTTPNNDVNNATIFGYVITYGLKPQKGRHFGIVTWNSSWRKWGIALAMAQYVMTPMRRRTSLMVEERTFVKSTSIREFVANNSGIAEETDQEFVNINVGGVLFRTRKRTLENISDTKLSNLSQDDPNYDANKDEYFFDRNPAFFPWILDYYRQRELHMPRSFCAIAIQRELGYWGLTRDCLEDCCKKAYLDSLDEIATNEILLEEFNELPKHVYGVESTIGRGTSRKSQIWNFLDKPQSSLGAQVWSYVYLVLTVFSILTFFVETLPAGRVEIGAHRANTTAQHDDPHFSNHKIQMLMTTEPHHALIIFDIFCMLFFSIEFIVRLSVCPRRWRLMKRTTTIFDLFYLIPVWMTSVIHWADRDFWRNSSRIIGLLILQAFKVMRVFRIFRVVQHYRGLKILWLALKASVRELVLLAVFVMLAITIFACFIYCAEIFNENSFDNAVIGLWWALITMTTVGYGDFYPETWTGYIVGGFCALTGIILIGMPVPIIASNFHAYYGLRIPDERSPWEEPEVSGTPSRTKNILMKKRKVSPMRPPSVS